MSVSVVKADGTAFIDDTYITENGPVIGDVDTSKAQSQDKDCKKRSADHSEGQKGEMVPPSCVHIQKEPEKNEYSGEQRKE